VTGLAGLDTTRLVAAYSARDRSKGDITNRIVDKHREWRIESLPVTLLGEMPMLQGFKNFLMRGDVIVVVVGLSVALAFSNLVKAFTDDIINPLIAAAQGTVKGPGFGWQLVSGGGDGTYLNLGALISAIIYFIIFMTVVYFLIVAPYKYVMAQMGKTVFGEPPPTKTCPACLSELALPQQVSEGAPLHRGQVSAVCAISPLLYDRISPHTACS
jgi:large conductance mechanosensitive channel